MWIYVKQNDNEFYFYQTSYQDVSVPSEFRLSIGISNKGVCVCFFTLISGSDVDLLYLYDIINSFFESC